MPHLQTNSGSSLYYELQGSGPPLLLIMGTGLDHSVWDKQVRAYRDDYTCILFDNPGAGQSTRGREHLTTSTIAADAIDLLEGLGIDEVHVSGLSLGSCVAQQLTLARPEMVQSLQLHGTWARTDGYAGRKFRAQIRLLQEFDLRSFYEINVLWFITPEFFLANPDGVAAQIDSIVAAAPDRAGLIEQYRADLAHDTILRLPAIAVPTLVTVGSFDVAVPPLYSREVAAAIPGAELVQFQGGGHLHNVEQPEEFNRVTLDFLGRVST